MHDLYFLVAVVLFVVLVVKFESVLFVWLIAELFIWLFDMLFVVVIIVLFVALLPFIIYFPSLKIYGNSSDIILVKELLSQKRKIKIKIYNAKIAKLLLLIYWD